MSVAVAPFELPTRRVSRGQKMQLGRMSYFLHCGFHPDGTVREIFVSSRHESAAAVAMMTETCIAHSHRLQHGARLCDLEVRSDLMLEVISKALEIERDEARSVLAQYADMGLTLEQWREKIANDDARCHSALSGEAARVAAL